MKIMALAAALAAIAGGAAAKTPVLTVYTYDSFISDWGPGPAVEKAFEARCGCDLRFVGMGDGAAVLARLRLEGKRSPADVVLGLDTNLMAAARATGLFASLPHPERHYNLPIAWNDALFQPFDWGYFAFVYDRTRLETPPHNFRDLAASDLKIVIEDPRSSTPGLGLLLWVKKAYGDGAQDIWTGLADNIVTVTKGWSQAYGMFLHGEADMVLSYSTSPAYHLIAEKDDSKAAALFDEGHYMQIEVAAKLAASDTPDLADEFLDFMASDAFQSLIPTTNWMYPALMPKNGLPAAYKTLIQPETALFYLPEQVPEVRKEALSEWLSALSK